MKFVCQQSDSAVIGLRERAVAYGLGALGDPEVLELFLYRCMPTGARTWAQVLLGTWGTLDGVLAADIKDLEAVIGKAPAADLKVLHEAALRLAQGQVRRRDVIASSSALEAYLRIRLSERTREQFRVLFLDRRNHLIADEVLGEGTVDHAPVYPREIVRRALQLDACAVILVHNHPSGQTSPSTSDLKTTQEIVDACGPLRIVVHDHLLVAGHEVISFKALGLMK
ncbi:DNA repair protein RadC [Phenylobacterium sp.]|uniref:RadC family protein n=1 Tax=Phenylobacterium sp. TaxID=1871053 RepID=UPI002737857A|nr:DNA repair protein RadC [Phenylobacterium sp.]MDP3870432.1 DNA repair protein RadC [Phenylobacterium sp.]